MTLNKPTSPPCGIYVRIDDFSDMQAIITSFRQMAMVINRTSDYEKNMHVVELVCDASDSKVVERITDLVPLMQSQGIVAIVSGKMDDFECYGADGILLENPDEIKCAREKLGDDAIIGLTCGASKDSPKGIDYVTLNADPSLISGHCSKTDIICVAMGDHITKDNCVVLARAGASFVEVSDYIFNYEKGTMQATVNILDALERAAQVPKSLN